jgi:DeoR family fructose operon transcriptional repressor
MLPEKRKRKIVSLVSERGSCTVEELSDEFGVSTATIRRDLNALTEEGRIERSHGGALPVGGVGEEHSFASKETENLGAKQAIGRRAAREIEPGLVACFDAGTTVSEVGKHAPKDEEFVAVTNSVPLVFELEETESQVKLTGGSFRRRTQALVGPTAEAYLERKNFDLAFIGTNAITLEEGLSTPDEDEARIKSLMAERADRVVLVADGSKLGDRSFIQFADLSDLDAFVTDADVTDEQVSVIEQAGVELLTV